MIVLKKMCVCIYIVTCIFNLCIILFIIFFILSISYHTEISIDWVIIIECCVDTFLASFTYYLLHLNKK